MNIVGLHSVVVFGTADQQACSLPPVVRGEHEACWLPPVIRGEHEACFRVTESDAGLDTLQLKTRAVREGDDGAPVAQRAAVAGSAVARSRSRSTPRAPGSALAAAQRVKVASTVGRRARGRTSRDSRRAARRQ